MSSRDDLSTHFLQQNYRKSNAICDLIYGDDNASRRWGWQNNFAWHNFVFISKFRNNQATRTFLIKLLPFALESAFQIQILLLRHNSIGFLQFQLWLIARKAWSAEDKNFVNRTREK